MSDVKASFKSGNSVCIVKGLFTGHTGEVIGVTTMMTSAGVGELIWVRLAGGKVDGFSAESLKKRGMFPKRRAA